MHSVRLSTLSYFIYSVLLFHFALPLYFRYFLTIISIVSIVVIIRPCHKAAILPYCPGGSKKLCFTTQSLIPMVSIARLSVVKQSFFGLPGQYGRRVPRMNSMLWVVFVFFFIHHSPIFELMFFYANPSSFFIRFTVMMPPTLSLVGCLVSFSPWMESWSWPYHRLSWKTEEGKSDPEERKKHVAKSSKLKNRSTTIT